MTTDASVLTRLEDLFGARATTNDAVRRAHGRGEGVPDVFPPDLVVFPESNEEIASLLAFCNDTRTPVIAFGAGTSLEGHVQARHGGVCLDLTRMNAILSVSAEDLDCRVQAGVTRLQLNAAIRDQGLFFPLDPGADATLGGMAATRASGTNAVRYGTMREVALGLTVVTPDGRIIHTGGRARKSAAGYDLTRLYLGSEGTLGIISEVQLRLFGLPEAIAAAVVAFDTLDAAIETAVAVMQTGVPVARMEVLDEAQMRASIAYSKLDNLPAKPALFFEFHGRDDTVASDAEAVRVIAQEHGGGAFQWARAQEDRTRLWKARHDALYATRALSPGRESFSTDACVPISQLARCIAETRADADESGLICTFLGHVGDGNFHVIVLFDPQSREETARAEALAARVSRRAIAMGGTCTGEHGIGVHKLDVLKLEHGEAVDVMRDIKQALDPNGIMNPGKTIPPR